MAKTGGLGQSFYIGGNDVTNDVGSVTKLSTPFNPIEMTGIDKLAFERVGGLRSASLTWNSYLNTAVGGAHPVLSVLPTADVYCQWNAQPGATIGNAAFAVLGRQLNYDGTREKEGALLFAVDVESDGFGGEWGVQLTAGKRTDTTATNGTSFDQTVVSTTFGWQAYLQVFALTGTNVIVTLQDSADNSTFANLTSGAFTSVTSAPTSQRIAGGATDTVRRYVRAITSGTFSSATFAVVFVRNASATAF